MILVWSSEGSPLQYVGLALFLIQFLAPQIFDSQTLTRQIIQDELSIGGLPLLIMIICLVLGVASFMAWFMSDLPGIIGGVASAVPVNAPRGDGTRDNPVDVDAQDDFENATNNDNNEGAGLMNAVRRSMQSFSSHYLILASVFILPLSLAIPIIGSSILSSSSGTVAVTVLAIAAHACMAMAAYGVLREFLSGNANNFPGNRRGRMPRARKYTVGEIADIVRKVPVEEFASEAGIKNGECSISQMKRILVHRGAGEAAERCLTREDLVNEICRVRNYENECTICSEDYEEGDPLRVLPCKHEYHLHCFDRWMYTFATDSRRNAEPSCPLCKYKLR